MTLWELQGNMEVIKEKIQTLCRKSRKKKPQKTDSKRPLMDSNDLQDAEEERSWCSQERHNVLFSSFQARTDGPERSEPNSSQRLQPFEPQDFPELPADLDQHLEHHLVTVGEIVSAELERFCSSESGENLKNRIDSCHRRTFDHLHALLKNVGSSKSCFLLMKWVLQTFLRQEQHCCPDTLLLTEWEAKAEEKLLPHVQKDLSASLSNILHMNRTQSMNRTQRCVDDEEAYIGLYLDIIQCLSAMTCTAQNISPGLHDQVQNVCFQELLHFWKSYATEQADTLTETMHLWKKNKENMETIHFLKTLRTCEELRKYVQSKGKHSQEILSELKAMETLILKFLGEIVTELAETYFKDYFKPGSSQLHLFNKLRSYFPHKSYFKDEQKAVMAEAYDIIAHIFLKHLIRTSRKKLERWSSAVDQAVSSYTEELQRTVSELAPGLRCRPVMLLSIPDVLKSDNIDSLKLIFASSQRDCGKNSKDLDLIPDLLRWKGLSKARVTEVLEALPGGAPTPRSTVYASATADVTPRQQEY